MKSQGLMVVVTFVVGMVIILDFFFPIPGLSTLSSEFQNWGVIIAAFALGLAAVNLLRVHIRRVTLKRGEWWNSLGLVTILIVQTIIGVTMGTASSAYSFGFDNVLTPLGATMYAMLAFWVASASYRAFTARSIDAAILLISSVIVMLGNAPIGEAIWIKFPEVGAWFMDVPNMAAQRGIMIGAGVGAIALGIRILMGIERGHLGAE